MNILCDSLRLVKGELINKKDIPPIKMTSMQMIFKTARTFLMFKDELKVVNTPLLSYQSINQSTKLKSQSTEILKLHYIVSSMNLIIPSVRKCILHIHTNLPSKSYRRIIG